MTTTRKTSNLRRLNLRQPHACHERHQNAAPNRIDACVQRDNLEAFFRDLDSTGRSRTPCTKCWSLVEKPLFEIVMREAGGNQSKAAQWLGINRNTLRRKLIDHNLA